MLEIFIGIHSTLIDDQDAPIIAGHRCHVEKRGRTFYVRLRTPGQRGGGKYLHNLIMGGRSDHRDGNGLNNVRSNLRRCTQAQNGLNRAPKAGKRFKGVCCSRGKFYAEIYINRIRYSETGFNTEEAAARAYDALAIKHHGEWAKLNFPLTPTTGAHP